MSKRLDNLKRRRALLVSQAAVQRSELSISAQDLQQHLRLADMGFAIVKAMREHPGLTLASASMLFPARKNKLVIWGRRLFTTWEVFSLVRKQLRNSS